MKHFFIVNPSAGKGEPMQLTSDIEAACIGEGVDYDIHVTDSKDEALSYIRSITDTAQKIRVYSVGGDGTLNDVITGTVNFDNVEIGCVACGTGNDFVKTLGVPAELTMDFRKLMNAPVKKIDLIQVGDLRCINMCNIGLDSNAAFYMQQYKRLPFMKGSMPYALGVFRSLIGKTGNNFTITYTDENDTEQNCSGCYMLAAIGNGQYYGGNYRAAPLAVLNDGLLDMCLVDRVSRFKVILLIGTYKAGEHLGSPAFSNIMRYTKVKKLTIIPDSDIRLCIDGEIYTRRNLEITVAPQLVNFIVPQ